MRTLHVGLRVADLERSLAFYTEVGYEVIGKVPATEFGSLTMLKLPGDEFVTVELVHDPGGGTVDPGGLNHLVIQVDSMQATVAQLIARGIEVEAPASPDGSRDFWTAWVTDPDGYRIELVQWPPAIRKACPRQIFGARSLASDDRRKLSASSRGPCRPPAVGRRC